MADVVRGSQMANVDPRRIIIRIRVPILLRYDCFIKININKLDALETVH